MNNNVKKLAAATLAAAMAASLAGCGDQSWSYRTNDTSLTTGTYIYNLLNGYYEAQDLVESPDEVKNIMKAEVTGSDSDAETKTVEQYSIDVADETSMRMIAVEELFKKYDLTLDETEDNAARSYATQVWSTAKKTFEGYGISEDSFNYCYADYSVKYGQVFETHYGEEGEAYVNDEELKKYFEDNHTGYAYFSISMAETNESGETEAKNQEEFDKAKSNFESYAKQLNDGSKTYTDVIKQYIEDYDALSDPTYSGSFENDGENTLGTEDEVFEELKSLDEGKASVVTTGEGATTLYYLVYRPKYSEIEDYYTNDSELSTITEGDVTIYNLKSGYSRYSLLNEMKSDEFKDYLNEYAASLDVEKNETAIKGYKPKMFVTKDSD